MKMIEAINLTKRFDRNKNSNEPAVMNATFTINQGEIFTVLGTNGAGKTTTLRMLATILKPTSGTAIIYGHDIIKDPEQVRKKIGFITGETKLYDRFSPRELFFLFGQLYNMNKPEIETRIEKIADILRINQFLDKRINLLSDGMKQKVSLGRTIIHDPTFLILDEPLTGLDIFARRAVIEFIKILKDENKSIVFSTHVMSEAEELCDKLAFIDKGMIVEMDKKERIKEKYKQTNLEDIFNRAIKHE